MEPKLVVRRLGNYGFDAAGPLQSCAIVSDEVGFYYFVMPLEPIGLADIIGVFRRDWYDRRLAPSTFR
jgi:hypothetical protein